MFTLTTTIYICLHFNAFRVKLWLEGVEFPIFSAPASVLQPLLFVYACAPSLTNRPNTVFIYLTLFPALVIYTRFGNLPFFRWMFCGVYRVFSAGTR